MGAVIGLVFAAVTALPILPTEKSRLVSLDGEWAFSLYASETNSVAAAEGVIAVPSSWEMRGYGTPLYDEEISGEVGVYRRSFTVPSEWPATDRVFLRFEGIMFGAVVRVNGREVGDFTSSFNAHVLEITEAVRRDGENELVVRTHGHPMGGEFDCNDDWTLHGIHRSVTLCSRPARHIIGWNLETSVQGGNAAVRVEVRTSDGGAADIRLLDSDGCSVGTGAVFTVANARLWSSETPDLYDLELNYGGETIRRRVGLREVTWSSSSLFVNGRPIRLRGVNHHDLAPFSGRAVTAEEQRRDVALMKRANINFIRTSHYPPSEALLEACDELGVYVMDEVPFGLGDRFLEDASYGPILFERARLTLERDRNRTCVIIWSIGNENPVTELTRATGHYVKAMDPKRPWCFPMQPHYFAKWWKERGPTDGGDLINCHYPQVISKFEKFRTNWLDCFNRPFLSGEYAHAYGLDSGLLETYDRLMSSATNYIGGAVWMFQDQGIYRKASDADARWREALVHPDAGHVYDSHGTHGTDGIVYSDRTPQTDYFELRKVFAPVRISDPKVSLSLDRGLNAWDFEIENRYDFTNLSEVKGVWRLVADGRTIGTGDIKMPEVTPHATGKLEVRTEAADPGRSRVCWLELEFVDPRSAIAVYERSFPLRLDLSGIPSGGYDFEFDERTGRIRFVSGHRRLIDSPLFFRTDRRGMLAKDITIGKSSWKPQLLEPKSWRVTKDDGKAMEVEFVYTPTNPAPETAGSISMRVEFIRHADHLGISYSVIGDRKRVVTENGLAFRLNGDLVRFDWVGSGPYECYPEASMLSEFGMWTLLREDLYFPGNRMGVRWVSAVASEGAGLGVGLDDIGANVALERSPEGVILSQNCLCAGKGGKFTPPLSRITVKPGEAHGGSVSLYAIETDTVRSMFGDPRRSERPFPRGYDE